MPDIVHEELKDSSSSEGNSSSSGNNGNGGAQQQGSEFHLVDPASAGPSLTQKTVESEGLKKPALHREVCKGDSSQEDAAFQDFHCLTGDFNFDSSFLNDVDMSLFDENLLNQQEEAGHVSSNQEQGAQDSSEGAYSLITCRQPPLRLQQ